jgi:hypothetical protein
MPCLISHSEFCRHDLENEVCSSRPQILHGDFALVPLPHSHRGHSNRSLAQHINDDNALEARCALQHRSFPSRAEDAVVIDRNGPFIHTSCTSPCRGYPHHCDDYLDAPNSHRRFPHTYPLQCMEPGGVRWSPDQIHAYNRDVIRHNNQIARRRDHGVPGEYMMLHPVMDPHGRFAPGFDRPLRLQDFLGMDGKRRSYLLSIRILPITTLTSNRSTLLFPLSQVTRPHPLIYYTTHKLFLTVSLELHLDTQRQHYNLPTPETPQHLQLLSSTEHHLRHILKQLQLLQLHGANHLAEQLLVQLRAMQQQHTLPGLLAPPRSLGSGLAPDFDNPMLQRYGATPLFGYGGGNGVATWNQDLLSRQRLGREMGRSCAAAAVGDDAPWIRPALYSAAGGGDHAYGFTGGWPGFLGYDAHGLGMSGGGGGPSSLTPFMGRIAGDGGGGRGRRYGSFN